MKPTDLELVLASASPRRREILDRAGYRFEVRPSGVEEDGVESSDPGQVAESLALAKARAVAPLYPDKPVVGADTLVVLGDRILNKPVDEDEAVEMLRSLSGRTHTVYTGLAVVWLERGETVSVAESTEVTFRDLDEDEIIDYVAGGEPMDKAGAYGIQGLGSTLVAGVEGCFYNVMGLPVARLTSILKDILEGEDNGKATGR
jgi:septum formation protein